MFFCLTVFYGFCFFFDCGGDWHGFLFLIFYCFCFFCFLTFFCVCFFFSFTAQTPITQSYPVLVPRRCAHLKKNLFLFFVFFFFFRVCYLEAVTRKSLARIYCSSLLQKIIVIAYLCLLASSSSSSFFFLFFIFFFIYLFMCTYLFIIYKNYLIVYAYIFLRFEDSFEDSSSLPFSLRFSR